MKHFYKKIKNFICFLFNSNNKDNHKELLDNVSEISNILNIKFEDLVSWNEIKKWSLGETKLINETFNTKIYQSPTKAKFFTKLPPKTSFELHWHDCTELCFVLSGTLTDGYTGHSIKENDKLVINRGSSHIPSNLSDTEDCYILVEFYKN